MRLADVPELEARLDEVVAGVQVTGVLQREGPPREFTRLAPLLRRFFLRAADDKGARKGVTLIVDFPEKIVPAGASPT